MATTLRTLRQMAASGEAFACLTCYDATTARWLERAGVHCLLVGDSAANVILGESSTIHVPAGFLVTLTAAVKRGAPGTVVMADLPFGTYHRGVGQALRTAERFMTRGRADIVKLECDGSFCGEVRALTRAGIPVCAHIGSRPQRFAVSGGPAAAGRTEAEAAGLAEDAAALEEAGAAMVLIEAVPAETASRVVERVGVPVIGIGAGPACHGQILVLHDLLGLTDEPPRFAEAVADLGERTRAAGEEWVRRVAARRIGGRGYAMKGG